MSKPEFTTSSALPGSNAAGYTPPTATATPATASTYDPSKYVVTPDQTVEGRAANLVKDDSVLMQQARVRANQDAQSKGLLSSSLAVGAGQNAVLDKAVPIASQDAAAYNAAMTNTMNAENAAKNFGAASKNQASLANAQLETDVSKTNAGMAHQWALANLDADTKVKLANLDVKTRTALAQLDADTRSALGLLDVQSRQLLQANTSAQAMFQSTITDITNISMNATMSQEAKDAAVATQIRLLRQGLALVARVSSTEFAALSDLDLSQYFKKLIPPSPSPSGQGSEPSASNLGNNAVQPQPTRAHPAAWFWDNRTGTWR
jgi:hypothetical protein